MIKAVFILLTYLTGGVPFGFLVGKLKGIDIRQQGSRNVGATNVFRVVGKRAGTTVYVLDAFKGFLPVLTAKLIWPGQEHSLQWFHIGVGLAAILGHIFTPYLRFKGGKGVATASGVIVALEPTAALIALACFAMVLLASGYVSLGSMIAALAFPISAALIRIFKDQDPLVPIVALGWLLCLMILVTHKKNIVRLINGTENRFSPLGKKNAR